MLWLLPASPRQSERKVFVQGGEDPPCTCTSSPERSYRITAVGSFARLRQLRSRSLHCVPASVTRSAEDNARCISKRFWPVPLRGRERRISTPGATARNTFCACCASSSYDSRTVGSKRRLTWRHLGRCPSALAVAALKISLAISASGCPPLGTDHGEPSNAT